MRKLKILLIVALTAVVIASLTFGQAGRVSAQGLPPVGVVVDYLPGQSLTMMDKDGTQHQYTISTNVNILPPGRASSLAVGSFVTIIAPASLNQGKQVAVGIVVHPHIPDGWNFPTLSATPPATSTAVGTFTTTAPGTALASETATGSPPAIDTATETATGTQLATETTTATENPPAAGTATDTPTATATPIGGGNTAPANTLIEWLRSLFQQILTSR